jgi:hypothetical protein
MRLDAIDVHKYAVNHPRDRRPGGCPVAVGTVLKWSFVVGRGRGHHDQAATRSHLPVCKKAVVIEPPSSFLEPEGSR